MDRILIRGGRVLSGSIPISGAKNAALPLMAAGLLSDGPLTLTNAPRLSDIRTMTTLLQSLGAEVSTLQDGKVLAMNVIEEIHKKLPNVHLVMHGSSSVPQELQDKINAYGGKIAPTWGVPVEEIERGIKFGVRKVNIDTDLRMALTGAIRKVFAENPAEFDPRKYLAPGVEAMAAVCRDRFERFGAAGMASKIVPLPLSQMAKRYVALVAG